MKEQEPGNRGEQSSPLGTALSVVLGFLVLFHFIGIETWGHGKATFVRMLGLAALLLAAPRLVRLERRVGTSNLIGALLIGVGMWFGVSLFRTVREKVADPGLAMVAIDIAQNTYAAGTHFLEGHNPYLERCQLGHRIEPGPHVVAGTNGLEMYGLRYVYGFPYFPAMMLAYLPFRPFFTGYHAIRAGNAFYLLLATLGVAWLAARSVRRDERTLAIGLSICAYLLIEVLAPELFQLAVTDVCIAAVAVLAYIAVSYDRAILAGILLGVVQGAKLLPGPLLLLPAMAYFPTRTQRVRIGVAYLVTSAAIVVPALLSAPEEFLSSTIAFYLSYHGVGDDTSLYWYLPEWAKGPFLATGFVLAAGFSLHGFRRPFVSVGAAAGQAFLAYFLFTAFNRMTHLNYLWGIHSLGAVAVATVALATTRSLNPASPAPELPPPPHAPPR